MKSEWKKTAKKKGGAKKCKKKNVFYFKASAHVSSSLDCAHPSKALIAPSGWADACSCTLHVHQLSLSVSSIAGWLNSNSSPLRSPGGFTPESTCQTPFPPHSLQPLNTRPAAATADLHMERVQTIQTLGVTLQRALALHTRTVPTTDLFMPNINLFILCYNLNIWI